jgi:hypothetical protein
MQIKIRTLLAGTFLCFGMFIGAEARCQTVACDRDGENCHPLSCEGNSCPEVTPSKAKISK